MIEESRNYGTRIREIEIKQDEWKHNSQLSINISLYTMGIVFTVGSLLAGLGFFFYDAAAANRQDIEKQLADARATLRVLELQTTQLEERTKNLELRVLELGIHGFKGPSIQEKNQK